MSSKSYKKLNKLTMIGHMCSDINQGAVSAVIPFLVMNYGYSYFAVSVLVLASNVASAVIQPLFGYMGDKKARPWFMAVGVMLAGIGMTLIGFTDRYPLIVFFAMISGTGVAMFHPEGGRIANLSSGENKGEGMSIFAVGGNVGFFIGPLMVATALTRFGMHGTVVFAFPAIICGIVLLMNNSSFMELGIAEKVKEGEDAPKDRWDRFALIMSMLSIRSIVGYGHMVFIPLFLVGLMGQTEAMGASAISLYSVSAAVGTFFSGKVANKVGVGRVAIVGYIILVAGVLVFAYCRVLAVSLIVIAIMAIAADIFYPSSVALGMHYVPNHLGTASGLNYGVAISVGGLFEPVLGKVGDAFGLMTVMYVVAGLSAIGIVLAAIVEHNRKRDFS